MAVRGTRSRVTTQAAQGSPRTRAPASEAKPTTITVRSERAPTNEDGKLACAQLPFIPNGDTATLAQAATAAGMEAIGNDRYVHPKDKSWVFLDANGRLQRGKGTVQFQGIPQPYVEPPDPALAKKLEALLGSTPRIPASMKEYALANIGFVDAHGAASTCARAGFAQVGSTWIHPDGSWVNVAGGRVSVGWKGHPLEKLPYSNPGGWI